MFCFTCTKFWPAIASRRCVVLVGDCIPTRGLSTWGSLASAIAQVPNVKKRVQRRKPIVANDTGQGVSIHTRVTVIVRVGWMAYLVQAMRQAVLLPLTDMFC